MQGLVEFLRTDNYLIIVSGIIILLLISFLIILIQNVKLKKQYRRVFEKLGNGKNIEEDLKNYFSRIENVEKENLEIEQYCKNLDEEVSKCVQKIGMVRYSAFKDTGSDLSFALAMLDENNNGIVLNGIYSREMSNIYAKPVEAAKSTYTLSEEETEAIAKAVNSNNVYKIR